jgi:hypothetical protein
MTLPDSSLQDALPIHLLAPSAQDCRSQVLLSNCIAYCLLGWIQESLRPHILISQPVLPVLHAYWVQMAIPVAHTNGGRTFRRPPGPKAKDRPR